MLQPNYYLIQRLERAEHLIRADMLSNRLKAHEFELKADLLSEQADILHNAANELWGQWKEGTDF